MFIIIDCDDEQNLQVVKEVDIFANYDAIPRTLYFDTYEEADEYAERHCGDCEIVEIDV